jgi:hypothetical protein
MKDKIELLKSRIYVTKEILCGLYFLFDKDEIVYVGKTRSGWQRISKHFKDKKFDSYYFLEMPNTTELQLLYDESRYITKYLPKYNKNFGAYSDNEYVSIGYYCSEYNVSTQSVKDVINNNSIPFISVGVLKKYKLETLNLYINDMIKIVKPKKGVYGKNFNPLNTIAKYPNNIIIK